MVKEIDVKEAEKELKQNQNNNSIKNKINQFFNNLDKYIQNYRVKELSRLEYEAKKTKLQAQITKNRKTIEKNKISNKNDYEWDFPFSKL